MKERRVAGRSSAGRSARFGRRLLVHLLCMRPARRVGCPWGFLCKGTGKLEGAASASRLQIPNLSPQCSAVFTQLSILESYWPGPFDRKSFLAPLPRRRLSPQAGVSERKTGGTWKRPGASPTSTPTPGYQGPVESPFRWKDHPSLFPDGPLLDPGISFRIGVDNPPSPHVCPQCAQPFNSFKGSQNPDIQTVGERAAWLPAPMGGSSELQHQCVGLRHPRQIRSPSLGLGFSGKVFLPFRRVEEEVWVGEGKRPAETDCGGWVQRSLGKGAPLAETLAG